MANNRRVYYRHQSHGRIPPPRNYNGWSIRRVVRRIPSRTFGGRSTLVYRNQYIPPEIVNNIMSQRRTMMLQAAIRRRRRS